jgi:hypothetical protein
VVRFICVKAGGRLTAFLFGWSELVLIRASATGAIATVFSEYLVRSLGYDPAALPTATHYIAAAAIIVTAAINIRGVQLGALVTGISTVAERWCALWDWCGGEAARGTRRAARIAHLSSAAGTGRRRRLRASFSR